MTPHCPKCKAVLKEDYGMATCASCGAILFIDMDGIAQIYEDASSHASAQSTQENQEISEVTKSKIAAPAKELDPAPFEFATSDELSEAAPEPFTGSTPEELASLNEYQPVDSFNELDRRDAQTESPQPAEEMNYGVSSEAPNEDIAEAPADLHSPVEADDNSMMDAWRVNHGEPAPEESTSTEDQFGAPGDPLGLNAYANSELSSARDGLLLFKILISGIDSKELRESLREALEDSRFAWSADQLMASISKGALSIENVSPVKATILINRIKRLPVKIVWEQHAITQMDES